jgi:hypothetical protein
MHLCKNKKLAEKITKKIDQKQINISAIKKVVR